MRIRKELGKRVVQHCETNLYTHMLLKLVWRVNSACSVLMHSFTFDHTWSHKWRLEYVKSVIVSCNTGPGYLFPVHLWQHGQRYIQKAIWAWSLIVMSHHSSDRLMRVWTVMCVCVCVNSNLVSQQVSLSCAFNCLHTPRYSYPVIHRIVYSISLSLPSRNIDSFMSALWAGVN